jgi:single-strand DNA-binding protein
MANLNKVLLMGNLTRDPEMKYLPNGTPVCELGMAINRRWNDQQSGEKKEQVCYVDLTAYGRQGETLNQYMKKGRALFVEGRLDFSQWETPEGQKRSKLRVVVENFQFIGGREEGVPAGGGMAPAAAGRNGGRGNAGAPPTDMGVDSEGIPF